MDKYDVQILRSASLELQAHGDDLVRVAGVVQRIKNWWKAKFNKGFAERQEKVENAYTNMKGPMSELIGQLQDMDKAFKSQDPDTVAKLVGEVPTTIARVTRDMNLLSKEMRAADAMVPVSYKDEQGNEVSDPSMSWTSKGYKANKELIYKLWQQLPEEFRQMPIGKDINQPITSFPWFEKFTPDDLTISSSVYDLTQKQFMKGLARRGLNGEEIQWFLSTGVFDEFLSNLKNSAINESVLLRIDFPDISKSVGNRPSNQMLISVAPGMVPMPLLGSEIFANVALVGFNDLQASKRQRHELSIYKIRTITFTVSDAMEVRKAYLEELGQPAQEGIAEEAEPVLSDDEIEYLDVESISDFHYLILKNADLPMSELEKLAAFMRVRDIKKKNPELHDKIMKVISGVKPNKQAVCAGLVYDHLEKNPGMDIREAVHDVLGTIEKFERVKHRLEKQNIQEYDSYEDLNRIVERTALALNNKTQQAKEVSAEEQAQALENGDATKIFEDDQNIVYSPEHVSDFVRQVFERGMIIPKNELPLIQELVLNNPKASYSLAMNSEQRVESGAIDIHKLLRGVLSSPLYSYWFALKFQDYLSKDEIETLQAAVMHAVGIKDELLVDFAKNIRQANIQALQDAYCTDPNRACYFARTMGVYNIPVNIDKLQEIANQDPKTAEIFAKLRPSLIQSETNKEEQQVNAPTDETEETGEAEEKAASGPITRMVKRALIKNRLPNTIVSVSITGEQFDHNAVFAKVLSSALRQEIDAECSVKHEGNDVEVQAKAAGSRDNVVSAIYGISKYVADQFKNVTTAQVNCKVHSGKSYLPDIEGGVLDRARKKVATNQISLGKSINIMNSIQKELSDICKDLRMLGDDGLASKALCAYAAATGSDVTHADLSYSYMMRELRKGDDKRRLQFQKAFKKAFDGALMEDVDEPASVALMVAMKSIDYNPEEKNAL